MVAHLVARTGYHAQGSSLQSPLAGGSFASGETDL